MKKIQVVKIDPEGFYIEPVIVKDGESLPIWLIADPIPNGFYKPKWDWNGKSWVEGATQKEIEEITKPRPREPTETELLKEENEALKERVESTELTILMLLDII